MADLTSSRIWPGSNLCNANDHKDLCPRFICSTSKALPSSNAAKYISEGQFGENFVILFLSLFFFWVFQKICKEEISSNIEAID